MLRFPFLFLVIFISTLSTSSSLCPQYCHCNDSALSVACPSSSNLRMMPIFLNPQVRILSLANNQIKDLSLQFYQELVKLDLSGNVIPSLGKGNFDLKGLQVLNASYNQVTALETGAFQGLGQLMTLDVSGNEIERMELEVFRGLRNLRLLILDRNRLEFMDWEVLRGLEKLEKVSLRYNFIQVIEPSPTPQLLVLPSLFMLDVSSNQLTRIKSKGLSSFPRLQELNLCCNYIHTLEDTSFSNLASLQRVNLSQNRLSRVPTSLQTLSGTLLHLDLSANRLRDLGGLETFTHVQFLRVSDNPDISSLEEKVFAEMINLAEFEGEFLPNVTSISGVILQNKPSLQRFSLRYGSISTVPLDMVEDLNDQTALSLDLLGNPVECNCSAYKLFLYLKTQGEKYDETQNPNTLQQPYVSQTYENGGKRRGHLYPHYLAQIQCQAPISMAGILVKDLKSSDFSDCFTSQDHFQVVVISLSAFILSLILLIVGMRVCCWRKGRFSCKCPCRRHEKEFSGGDKVDRLFQPQQIASGMQILHSPGGKLFFSADNSTPSHLPRVPLQPPPFLPNGNGNNNSTKSTYADDECSEGEEYEDDDDGYYQHPHQVRQLPTQSQPHPLHPYNYNNFPQPPPVSYNYNTNPKLKAFHPVQISENEYTTTRTASPFDPNTHPIMVRYDYQSDQFRGAANANGTNSIRFGTGRNNRGKVPSVLV